MGVFDNFKSNLNRFLANSMINGLKSLGIPLVNQQNLISFGNVGSYVKPPEVNLAALWSFFKQSPEVLQG